MLLSLILVLRVVVPAERSWAGPACEVKEFRMILEGWTRGSLAAPAPCRVAPIEPQPTCPRAPCYNVACKAVIRYHAVVELPAGVDRLWPACFFKQQRMGLRSHRESGARKLDQYEPRPTQDFAGSVEHAVGYRWEAVPGRPRHFSVRFYDLPGWLERYWHGRPNAVAPKWFPLDWRYMYRAYLGPKTGDIAEDDYAYVRVDMEASVSPDPGVWHAQSPSTVALWEAFRRELAGMAEALGGPSDPSFIPLPAREWPR